MTRAETVNGIKVSHRPVCAEAGHQFAAFHGYCLICGTDGWDAKTRREIQAAQRQVNR